MIYLVDVTVTLKLEDIQIEVDEFDIEAMAKAAVERWLDGLRNSRAGEITPSGELLENWNRID